MTALDELNKTLKDDDKRIAIAVRYGFHADKNKFNQFIKAK